MRSRLQCGAQSRPRRALHATTPARVRKLRGAKMFLQPRRRSTFATMASREAPGQQAPPTAALVVVVMYVVAATIVVATVAVAGT